MQATPTITRLKDALNPPGSRPWLRLAPEDGWFTIVLVSVVVFTTIASIESVNWAQGLALDALNWATLAGLVLGYLVVQQGRIPGFLAHTVAVILGVLFTFQRTAASLLGGDNGALWYHTQNWFQHAVLELQSSSDNYVFVLFLAILSFLLAYITVWLVLHTRRPWLAALANGVVLLINLNYATDDKTVIFMVAYLMATLLLLVRFTLAENMRVWKARGLRFSSDLGWDFMQAGAIFAVIVLLLANLLPAAQPNQSFVDAWNSPDNPWQKVQLAFGKLFYGAGGEKGDGGTLNFFGSGLQISGKVKLPNVEIMRYKVGGGGFDSSQYLLAETLDNYDGVKNWSQSSISVQHVSAGVALPPSGPSDRYTNVTYDVTLTRVPNPTLLFTPGSEAQSFSLNTQIYNSDATRQPVTYAVDGTSLVPGQQYEAVGYVSSATVADLRAAPFPRDVPTDQRDAAYPSSLASYLSTTGVSPDVAAKAREAAAGTTTMYDAAVALENYLRTFTYSLDNPDPPAGQDAVAFFLQTKRGFCTDFASAMALMGRSLGMPTRIAVGFADGTYDDHAKAYIVKGTQAHVWTQVYFAGWGWINFEPTQSFPNFSRAVESAGATATASAGAQASQTPGAQASRGPKDQTGPDSTSPGGGNNANPVLVDAGIGLGVIIALALLAAALFLLWWRLLFRGLSPVASAFARVSRLGEWAGAPPRRSQTPAEYGERLAAVVPAQREAIDELSDLYARDRWGGGLPPEEAEELPVVYERVRSSLTPVILRRVRRSPLGMLRAARRRVREHDRASARSRAPVR